MRWSHLRGLRSFKSYGLWVLSETLRHNCSYRGNRSCPFQAQVEIRGVIVIYRQLIGPTNYP